ncbi:hypothetical protein GCM10023152_15930 [Agromyces bauzanensis]|uniref:Uncharacterized protein n=1 Tax=Agromyces bauzanensis TaxID=1308924 RepID=A0A917PQM2_9MICO|nr:hypothetical protein GCM10011372_28560 [Agromyces bauzanensis]
MTGTVTDAARVAAERARTMPLTPVDPPAAVIRTLEDAALSRIDVEAARRLVDLGRRFDRTVSRLRQELARRQDHAEEEPVPRPAWGWDAVGFLLALMAAPLLLAGASEGGHGGARGGRAARPAATGRASPRRATWCCPGVVSEDAGERAEGLAGGRIRHGPLPRIGGGRLRLRQPPHRRGGHL